MICGRFVCGVMGVLLLVAGSCEREEAESGEWASSECQGCTTPEEAKLCSDGLDNDQDGLVDCDDFNCDQVGCCMVMGDESSDKYCDDGCDNDGDGYTDCKDHSCSKGASVTVCKTPTKQPEDTVAACSDGLDNDWNGYFDCEDFSCSQSAQVTFCEGNDVTCSDKIDNDGNGYVDCGDFSCSRNSKVTVCK